MVRWLNSRGQWRTYSGRHTGKRRPLAATRVPIYARIVIPILLVVLIWRVAWRSPTSHGSLHASAAGPNSILMAGTAAWQRDVDDALAESLQNTSAGDISKAEIAVDRAESLLTAARLQSFAAAPAFFSGVNDGLDQIIRGRPGDAMLFQHVTEARVSLAELRSSLNNNPNAIARDSSGQVQTAGDLGSAAQNMNESAPQSAAQTPGGIGNKLTLKAIRIDAPRVMAAHDRLNLATLGRNDLDATLMPDTSEVLLSPTHTFADDVRVENVTIEGAAQTLDGIHWHNVTFIGTRLRYESGDLDLDNVRFVRCRFGFQSDERGARVASAIATSPASITIQ